MKKIVKFVAGVSLLAAALGVSAKPIEINIGHALSENSSYQVAAEHFAKLMNEKTNGEVTVKIFPSGTLGGELKLVQGLRTGVVDASIMGQPSLENTVREYRILSLPYLFNNYEEANTIMQGPVGDNLLQELDKYNMVGLGWGAIYARSMASMKPVNTVDDMGHLKVRVIQSPGYVEAYKSLGSQPTPTAYAELFLALQNGVVDAAELSPDQTVGDGFSETIKHYAVTEVHQLPSLFIMSKAKYAGYPEDVQQAIKESAQSAMEVALQYQDQKMADAFTTMEAKGITITRPDLTAFKEKARAGWPRIMQDSPGGEEFLRQIEEARQQ
ncbi:MAG: TRAP transporter substrate-binding protein [Paenalcaligenes sp.]